MILRPFFPKKQFAGKGAKISFFFAVRSSDFKLIFIMKYPLNLFIENSGEHWWEQNIFWSFTTPQEFWKISAPGALSILVTSVVLYSLTRVTLMSPGKDETRVCWYIYNIYIILYLCMYVYYVYKHVYRCLVIYEKLRRKFLCLQP